MEHFMTCESYGRKNKTNWRKIYENDSAIEEKIAIAKEAIERKTVRNNLQEGGQTSTLFFFLYFITENKLGIVNFTGFRS